MRPRLGKKVIFMDCYKIVRPLKERGFAMIPVKLKIQAFASYAEAAEIDFEKLDSLFLIHGETGAGKTAVLDAITYALYGESSGGDRTDMRCALPAAEKLPTLAEFIFKIRGELYKFTRSVTVTPRSKKLESKQDCFYFDKDSGCFRSFFENPKQSLVRAKAEELTGLSAEQFRQVIILPQGKFEQLLTSASRDKEEILSTLFGADKYTKLSDKLRERAETLRKKLDGETNNLCAMLAAEKIESAEELDIEIKKHEEEAEALFPKLNEARNGLAEIRERLTEAELLAAKFSELEMAEKRLAELDRDKDSAEKKRFALKKHEKALLAAAEQKAFVSAENNLADRKKRLALAEEDFFSAEEKFTGAEKKKNAVSGREDDYHAKSAELAVLTSLAPMYEKVSLKTAELSELSGKADLCAKHCADSEKKAKMCGGDISELLGKREYIMRNFSERIPELTARLNELKSGEAAEKRLVKYTSAFEKIQENITQWIRDADKLEAEKVSAESRYDELYECYIRNTAAELSSSLREGQPCPVCGSLSHPAPAVHSESAVTAAEVKNARAVFEKLAKDISDIQTKISGEKARIPAAEDYIASERKTISDTRYTAGELEAVELKYGEAVRENEKLPGIDKDLNKLYELKDSLEERLADETKKYEAARNALSKTEAELSALKENLDPRFCGGDSYAAGIKQLQADVNAFVCEKESSDREYLAAEKLKVQTFAAAEQARAEHDSAVSVRDSAYGAFLERLSFLGVSQDDYEVSLLSEENAAALAEQIKKYDLAVHSAQERTNALKKELAGKTPPPLDEIRADAGKSDETLSELSGRQALITERLNRLKKLSEEYSNRFAALSNERERSDKLSAFAGFMRGDRGISFTRYFLGLMLSLVTDEANRILADVSGGKFRLRVKSDYAANSKQGLDLEAETLTADFKAVYGVKNLSGGEKFLISLALSLGLSAVARSRGGGIDVEAMFIDEGFGSLDPASLKEAVSMLCRLAAGRNTIGIISHVEELKNVIPCGIRINKNPDGASFIIP